MNSPTDRAIDVLIERAEMLARALQRARHDAPYSDETAALAGKLTATRAALRQTRHDELAAAETAELQALLAQANVMDASAR